GSRRDFIKTLCGSALSAFVLANCKTGINEPESNIPAPQVYGPRTGTANPFVTADGRPILVCVEGTDISQMLRRGIEALGGLGKLVNNNQEVLIKPNCNNAEPYPGISSTDCILAIIDEIQNVSSGAISVGDQGYAVTDSVYAYMDLETAIQNTGANVLNLYSTYHARGEGWDSGVPDFHVYKEIYDAPVIINTSVLKRHHTAMMTCAIKNNVGTVAGSNATITREYLHYRSPNFLADLAEIANLVNPDLNIVDARSILTKGGPFYADGEVVDVNKVILCGDIVATDVYCAEIMAENDDFSPAFIEGTLTRAQTLGLGTMDLNQVEIIEIAA
ncbi:MAG: DUF362 domain-containing protein, partial [bacterium]|nr:DUF362 domain-containing protein [bacterium]